MLFLKAQPIDFPIIRLKVSPTLDFCSKVSGYMQIKPLSYKDQQLKWPVSLSNYSKHPLIRKNLFEIANIRIIGWILKGNSRKGIKNPFAISESSNYQIASHNNHQNYLTYD